MKLVTFEQWLNVDRVFTKDEEGEAGLRKFYGIAIGPDSEESRVRVDDRLLQAGHTLPLRAQRYAIDRSRNRVSPDLDAIATLQVALLESPEELAYSFVRPPNTARGQVTLADGHIVATSATLSFPFAGRRQALFALYSVAATNNQWSYTVTGVRYSPAKAQDSSADGPIYKFVLKSDATPQLDANKSFAFYVGGLDQAEVWDVLQLTITNTKAGAVTFDVDFEGIGEIGAL